MSTDQTRTEADTVREIAQRVVSPTQSDEDRVLFGADERGGTKILDLEKFGAHPRRATAQRTVYDAGSFAAYLHRHEGAATEVYADVQTATIVAILNSHEAAGTATGIEGQAGWQDHRITLKLTETPSWKAWAQHDGDLLGQEEFAEFAEEHAVDVQDPSPADLLDLAQSLEATKSVAFESGHRTQDGQTKLVYKETVEARAGVRGDLEIPKSLTLRLRPYIGGPIYATLARFRYRLRGQNLVLGYVLDRPDLIRESAFNDVVTALREGVQDDVEKEIRGYEAIDAPIFMGKP